MRVFRLLSAGTVAALLLLGTSTVVLGQETATDDGPQYVYGEVEGYLHFDMDNPHDCEVGFTSVNWLSGESTLLGSPTTFEFLNCYVPNDTLATIQDVVATFTGESGDTLTAHGSGDCIPDVTETGDVSKCWGTLTITGGTGLFEGATGEIHLISFVPSTESDHPDAAPGDVPNTAYFEGLIDY